jgi:hypothetical protein
MVGSDCGAAHQAYSRSRVHGSQPVARRTNSAPPIHGNFHQRNIDATFAFQKIVKLVLGLPRLFSFEPDLIGPAKKS